MRLDMLTKAAAAAREAAPKLKQLKDASKGVEAMFVKQLMGEMQKGTKLFGEGQSASIYGDLFNDAIAKQVADRGAFGIADLMVKQGTKRILAEAARTVAKNQEAATPKDNITEKTLNLNP